MLLFAAGFFLALIALWLDERATGRKPWPWHRGKHAADPKQGVQIDSYRRKRLRLALSDPGSVTPRNKDLGESVTSWQARAVEIVLSDD